MLVNALWMAWQRVGQNEGGGNMTNTLTGQQKREKNGKNHLKIKLENTLQKVGTSEMSPAVASS